MAFWVHVLGNKRLLLAAYVVALLGLLMFPIAGPSFRVLSIGADKWVHVALFGGLAVFLRWNLSDSRHAELLAIGAAFVLAVATEFAQSLVAYRSAEWLDLFAGFVGAAVGALAMSRILLSRLVKESVGILVALLGLTVGALFVLADLTGVGDGNRFGALQLVGTMLGALIIIGGISIYVGDSGDKGRRS